MKNFPNGDRYIVYRGKGYAAAPVDSRYTLKAAMQLASHLSQRYGTLYSVRERGGKRDIFVVFGKRW